MKIGFIGCGNMGSAILGGILSAGIATKEDILVSCKSQSSRDRINAQYGVKTSDDNCEIVRYADILFLAVKPQMLDQAMAEAKECIKASTLVVSLCAGKTLEALATLCGSQTKIVRTMPNTPAAVGEAMSALCPNELVTDSDIKAVMDIFESFGQAEIVPESLMDAVIGVSGSSPAYIYMIIEALADGAVAEGMPRAQAYKFAAQSVLGSAKMVLETGLHPGVLKDNVCSPGGTTIEGVAVLEERGLRDTIIAGERACVEKSRQLSK